MNTVELQWKKGSKIRIGIGFIESTGDILVPYLKSSRVIIITDNNVAKYHLNGLEASFEKANILSQSCVIEAGEQSKSFRVLEFLLEDILSKNIDSNITVIALGGGVIGDLSALIANMLFRGVSLIHIPTTVVAQVDSSIGGKSGINSMYGKNLIGTMYDAVFTLTDVRFLQTLPIAEFISGYAEVVKYAVLYDEPFFLWLQKNLSNILNKDENCLYYMVKRCCQLKSEVVASDKYNQRRVMLNFGHTVAHALEAACKYSISHGDAVSIGMVIESAISGFDNSAIKEHLQSAGLPISLQEVIKDFDIDKVYSYLINDKKVRNNILTLTLLEKIGKAYTEHVSCEFMRGVLNNSVVDIC